MYNESDETGKQFASVLAAAAGRDSYIESIKAEDVQTEQRKKLSALLDKMKGFNDSANKLDASSAKPNDASAVVVQAMQETARQLGSSVTLDPSDLKASLQRAQELLDDLQAADKGK
jgi:hypothetical protein